METNFDNWKTRVVILLMIVVLYGGCWWGVTHYIVAKEGDWSIRGQFGDMFGAVNALFSGLAFAGIIYTILLQREELRAQREELKLNREELVNTRKEFEQQNDSLKRQRFENTFFNLLEAHHRIITKRDIDIFYNRLLSLSYVRVTDSFDESILELRSKYQEIFGEFRVQMNLYLSSLVLLFEYIAESDLIFDDDRQFYFEVVRGNMNLVEKTVVYYHLALRKSDDNLTNRFREIEREYSFCENDEKNFMHKTHRGILGHCLKKCVSIASK